MKQNASPTNDVMAQTQVLEVISEPTSLNLDEIHEAQSIDDNLQPVIQGLVDKVKPPQCSLQNYPEEARALFSQWDSLVLEDSILFRRNHYPDGTTRCLQMVIPVKLRRPYVKRLHADLGHFGRAKTCMAVACQLPRILPGMVFFHWNVGAHLCNLQYASAKPSDAMTG